MKLTKKKKWIISGSVLIGIVGIVILLLFTLFSLKNVAVDFRTSTTNLTASQEEIIEKGDFAYNSPVIFHSKKGYTKRLEEAYPYIKVINIETVFPNKFIIHVSEREEVFAIASQEGFYICDQEFKVLRKTENFSSQSSNAILLSGITIKEEKVEGEFLKIENYADIFSAFVESNRLLFEQKALVKEIEFEKIFNSHTNSDELQAKLTLFAGQKVIIGNCQKMFSQKVASFLQVFSQLYSLIGKDMKIVTENGESEVVGVWDKEKLDKATIEINNYYTKEGLYYKILPPEGI